MKTAQEKQDAARRILDEMDATIESELWAGDQANTKHEERAVRELYRRRLRIEKLEAALRCIADISGTPDTIALIAKQGLEK